MLNLRREKQVILRNFIDGFILQHTGGDNISVSPGVCSNMENTHYIESKSAILLTLTNKTANTTYHVHVRKTLFSVEAFISTQPSVTDARRVGSFLTDPSSNIRSFTQKGDIFILSNPLPTLSVNAPSGGALYSLGTPSGIIVEAEGQLGCNPNADGVFMLTSIVDPESNSLAANGGYGGIAWGFGGGRAVGTASNITHVHSAWISATTNTASQVRIRTNGANFQTYFTVTRWRDARGKE